MARFLPFLNANGYLRRLRRRQREENDAFDLPDQRFVELFRMDKETLRELINMLEPHLEDGQRRHRVPKINRILAAMRFFSSGSYQRCVGQDCFINLSQSQICLAIHEVASAIEAHLQHFVRFPHQNEYPATKERIMERFGVPGVIGFVDGTHIPIHKPQRDVEHQYFNRKGYHSKNVQIVCGSNNEIFSVNAAHGGASHDAFIWRASDLNTLLQTRFTRGDRTSWLLGDSGYPVLPYLVTPVRNPLPNSPEFRFNLAHRKARSCVERTIGILKARFRCLTLERVLQYSPEKSGTIINACIILHNIMQARNLPLPPEEDIVQNVNVDNQDVDQLMVVDENHQLLNVAVQNRARIIHNYFDRN